MPETPKLRCVDAAFPLLDRVHLLSQRSSGHLRIISGILLLLGFGPLAFAQARKCPPPVAHLIVSSGSYSTQPGVSVSLHHFSAAFVPVGKTSPTCYERTIVIAHGDIFISNDSLTNLFATKLDDSNSKIRDFKIENGEGRVKLNGKINKLIPIAFTLEGPVTTDGTLLLLETNKIKADGIPVKGLLDLVGEHLANMLGFNGVGGVTVRENTLAFAPEQLAHVKGHLRAVETSAAGLTLHYGRKP